MRNKASQTGPNHTEMNQSSVFPVWPRRWRPAVWICGVLLWGWGIPLFSYAADPVTKAGIQDKIIHQVRVEGNDSVADSAIMAQVRSRPGSVFSETLISQDARRIIILPEIYDVIWKVMAAADDQVDIVFNVIESPKVRELILAGNKHIKTAKLEKELKFKKGEFLDRYLINLGADDLAEVYHKKGYYFVSVQVDRELLEKEATVRYVIVEGPRIRVNKVRFIGNAQLPTRKLKGKVKTHPYFPIFRKGLLSDDQLEEDRLALMLYYQEEGFLDARVFAQKQFNEDRSRVAVEFVIEEGIKYIIAAVRFRGNEIFDEDTLRESVTLETGKVLTQKRRTFAERAVKRTYGKEGYIYTKVRLDLDFTDREGEVDAVFNIEENEQYLLSRLIIRGNYETQDKVIRRDFDRHGFMPGGLYNTDSADRAKRRLLGKGLFEDVTVTPSGQGPAERDAVVDVTETRTGVILFGVGVDTNSGVMGQISLEQRNFDISRWPTSLSDLFSGEAFVGAGQRLRADFYPGTRVTRGRISFHESYLFDQPYYLDVNLYLFRRWRESYLEQRRGSSVSVGHRFENDWFVDGTLRYEHVLVSDLDDYIHRSPLWEFTWDDYLFDDNYHALIVAPPEVQEVEGTNRLTSFRLGVGQDSTDRLFMPTEGHKINFGWEQVGALGGEYSFASLSAGGTLYKTVYMDITERRTVWAGQIRGRKIIGDAPVFERFYAGGIGSMRGFDFRGVSPRGGLLDDPVGSDYLVQVGTELTHPLFEETIFGKLFCDTGMVSEGPYRVSVGFGIEFVVPQLFKMVPMHFDFGFPLIRDDMDEEELFSFTFGLSF